MRALSVRVVALTSGRIALTRPLNTDPGSAGVRASTALPGRTSAAAPSPVQTKERCAGNDRHAFAGRKLTHHPVDRRGDREPRLHGAPGVDFPNLSVAHAGKPHALRRGVREPAKREGIDVGTEPLRREVLFLRRDPFRHVKLRQRLAFAHGIERGANVELLDEAVAASLHDDDVAFVVSHVADCGDRARERPRHGLRRAYAEVLLEPRVNGDTPSARRVAGIDGDELHVHERRLAGLVEPRPRHHRIVPVQHALAA